MNILFTRSNSPLSRLIRWVTKEPVSHCSIEVQGKFVVHSNLLGVHCDDYDTFTAHADVWAKVNVPDDYEKLLVLFLKRSGAWYDFGAFFYLGLRLLIPWLPKKNLWQTTGLFLCTEWVTDFLDGAEDADITPYQLFKKMTAPK